MTSDEDRTKHAQYEKTYNKGENITYDENITQHDWEQIGENYEFRLPDDIELLKLEKLISKSDGYKISEDFKKEII